jgi:fructokinase
MVYPDNLSLHDPEVRPPEPGPVVVLGEVLWDVFPDSACLGGAPLNFAAHAGRLGHHSILISAVGTDKLGVEATRKIAGLGLDTSLLGTSANLKTGTATVRVDSQGQPTFTIDRPAAYDDVRLTPEDIARLQGLKPSWLYYGTLFPSRPAAKATLMQLLEALPGITRFYDANLRPGFDSLELVSELIATASVVKLNEAEAEIIGPYLNLPGSPEGFCRAGAERFGWRAVCVTLGQQGCAVFNGSEFVTAPGFKVNVVDTVGAGDAFAASFMHGLAERWPLRDTAEMANRVGALVASRAGAIPDWSLAEASAL